MDYNFSHDLKMENDLQLVYTGLLFFQSMVFAWSLHGVAMCCHVLTHRSPIAIISHMTATICHGRDIGPLNPRLQAAWADEQRRMKELLEKATAGSTFLENEDC